MDVLSDGIAAMRTGRPHSSRQWRQPPWHTRALPFSGAGFHVVLQGTCWLLPGGGEPIALGPGDVALLPHGGAHELVDSVPAAGAADTPAEPLELASARTGEPDAAAATLLLCGAYLLEQARPHPLLAELPDVIHLPARVGRDAGLRGTIDLLAGELAGPGRPGADGIVPALLETLLLHTLRVWYEGVAHRHPGVGWAAALRDPVVSAALAAIHREPARGWTVQSLGALAGLSRAPFARRFAALVGRPPLAYLTWWRMMLAARQLRHSDAPVRVVAERVGYTSEFAFAKAFKREYGMAPGRYRR